jgi:MFS family permease
MVAIANVQYGWTLFIKPIDQKHGWGITAIQLTFSIAITTETFFGMPLGGRLVDRFGPRLVWVSGVLVAGAWCINSIADSLFLFYAAAVADLGIDKVPVSILGLTLLTPVFAVSFGQVMNGLSRPVFGWVSDWFGRAQTMFISFLLEAVAFAAMVFFVDTSGRFVLLVGLAFFAWGQIFSLFPAICTDAFGSKFASVNYGMLYTAKGTASLLVPLANVLKDMTGTWMAVFAVAATFNLVAAMLALVLRSALKRPTARARTSSSI